ncbi:hypothetical protein [Thalassorhabdomicrobium marinisediminis]|uniref:hypothetical protein n=1 Tax=Thalassorhabdomicrobium marinisediminis TaxID=2170577 RepID=UPI0024917962|nr:hypothetical protein [Thalassorhabdomicrobium marinisediminis]
MSDALSDIRRLLPVLDTAYQAEQMKMGRIMARIRSLSDTLRELENPQSFDPLGPASRLGADVRWEAWVQERKDLITRELAQAYRAREEARTGMAAALSKLEAAREMERRAAAQARQLALRRASW